MTCESDIDISMMEGGERGEVNPSRVVDYQVVEWAKGRNTICRSDIVGVSFRNIK